MIHIDQSFLDMTARTAVEVAVRNVVNTSPVIPDAIRNAVSSTMINVQPMIKEAIEKAVAEVTSRPDFLHAMIRKAILDNSDKIKGSFEASMRTVGKRLALDPATLERVIEGVKAKLELEAEEHRAEMELRGGGAFA